MATLTDIMEVNQQELETLLNFNIKHGFNMMVFGPSGAGKTHMVKQACQRNNSQLTWCNLSVNERPDIQGYPKMNPNSLVTEFTTPAYLPVPETKTLEEKTSLLAALNLIKEDESFGGVANKIRERLSVLEKFDNSLKLNSALPFLCKMSNFGKDSDREFINYVTKIDEFARNNQQKVTIMFDEADKAPHDVLQPLLELLQFRTLNGRKLAINSCIVTCNLPDENAHTEKLSHAITNRCFIYKLNIDYDMWRKWAVPAGIHPLIVGYLGSNQEMIHKKPDNKDDTAYASPSPRAWSEYSEALYKLENDRDFSAVGNDALMSLKTTICAGKVGNSAAVKFEVWLKHYRTLDPMIESISEKGENPSIKNLNLEESFICAIGVCSRLSAEFKPNNKERINKVAKNVFSWLGNLGVEIQTAGVRNAIDYDLAIKYGIQLIPEVMSVFKFIKEKTD